MVKPYIKNSTESLKKETKYYFVEPIWFKCKQQRTEAIPRIRITCMMMAYVCVCMCRNGASKMLGKVTMLWQNVGSKLGLWLWIWYTAKEHGSSLNTPWTKEKDLLESVLIRENRYEIQQKRTPLSLKSKNVIGNKDNVKTNNRI